MAVFSISLDKIAEKAKADINTVGKKVTIDLFTKVLQRSPVGDPTIWKNPAPKGYVGGRFRANWNCALNQIDESTIDSTDQSRGASEAARAQEFPLGGIVYYTNSLPYAQRLEYEGWSSQAPAGMVRISAAEFDQDFEKAAKA